jgi:hypothetical protein
MRIGASLVLIALGAILKFAVTTSVRGVDLSTVGVILMIVGAVGLLISLALLATRRRTDVVVRDTGTTLLSPRPGVDPVDPRY